MSGSQGEAPHSSARERNWAPLLADLVGVIESALRRCGAPKEQALSHAGSCVLAVAEFLGGRMVYLPRGHRLKVAIRDEEIFRRFAGNNVKELAEEFGLTDIHIYSILRRQRALNRRPLSGEFK